MNLKPLDKSIATTVIILGALTLAGVGYTTHYFTSKGIEEPLVATDQVATTTTEQTTEPAEKAITPPTVYTQPPEPKEEKSSTTNVEVNQVKSEKVDRVEINKYPAPEPPKEEPKEEPAPAFTPPTPKTPTEIGYEVLDLYNVTGTVEHLKDKNKLRVTLDTGQQVVQDLVSGWEEKLKYTINKIK